MWNQWEKRYHNKVKRVSASNDALWAIDFDTNLPLKFDKETRMFFQKGNQQASTILAGLNGDATISDLDAKILSWVEAD